MRKAATLALALAAAIGSLAWFGRDPERLAPELPDLILAPADGRVVAVRPELAPRLLTGQVWRVAIFLSLWDVHVQRAPAAGRVVLSEMQAGPHRPAFHESAARNAGHWLGLETAGGPILILRTAGLVARRVSTEVEVGADVAAGQRIGRILFGSRVELYLPLATRIEVHGGDRVWAGQSVIGRWPS